MLKKKYFIHTLNPMDIYFTINIAGDNAVLFKMIMMIQGLSNINVNMV